MKKIWLDDIRDPKDKKIQLNYGSTGDEIWVKTADEAIDLLKEGDVFSISLDNDLGENQKEGYEVAKWIEENAFMGEIEPCIVKVHSANPVANILMKRAVKNAATFWERNK